jgi:protein O-mannosyl-transferase
VEPAFLIASALRSALILAGLAAVVFLAFLPALGNAFQSYDDSVYVTENPHVSSGLTWANTAWAFTSFHASNWHPLSWLSHQLDSTLFGSRPAGPHLTSLLLHIVNTLLLFLWLHDATGLRGRSAFVALIFGLHPLHVESVAWIAERKDVLSTFFWMLTLIAYTTYVHRPGIRRYLVVAVCLAAGLAAKPMLVTVPALLLLLDWWPLGRAGGCLWLEKVPLLLLSAASGVVTVWAQRQGGSVVAMENLPLALRLSNAAVSYVRYLGKAIWPLNLAVFYPFPDRGVPLWNVAASVAVLAAITCLTFAARKRRPWLAAGWGWYLLTLLPTIGIVQVGMQAMADRYMYVPMIGLLMAAAWQAGEIWDSSRRGAPALAAVAAIVVVLCAAQTWRQTHAWKDGFTLFTHAVKVTKDNFVAHDNLGVELDRLGRFDEALAEYRETLRIKPGDRHGEENYANATFAKAERLFTQGKLDEPLRLFHEGLRYRPDNATAHMYAGLILTERDEISAAIPELRRAIGIDAALARAHLGLGVALARSGQTASARKELHESLRLDQSSVECHFDLGLVEAALGNARGSLAAFDEALRLDPDYGPAHATRAQVLGALGRYEEARKDVAAAQAAGVTVDPDLVARLARSR